MGVLIHPPLRSEQAKGIALTVTPRAELPTLWITLEASSSEFTCAAWPRYVHFFSLGHAKLQGKKGKGGKERTGERGRES
jgi:hypothetical protein